MEQFERTALLIGEESILKLQHARVAIFGIGGVGGHAVDALARSGIGTFDLIDNDQVTVSNINRQMIALHSSVGRYKIEVMKERILDINPKAKVYTHRCFFLPETANEFNFAQFDYVLDAVDTITAKIELVIKAREVDTPIISCMGAGNKLDPTKFEIADIYKTQMCPLAKVMRKELKQRGIEHLKVVYSTEPAMKTKERNTPGSISFVPSVAGLIMAGEVIKDLVNIRDEEWRKR